MVAGLTESNLPHTHRKAEGFTDTPRAIAASLARWAVRNRDDRVLDAGAGTGVFVFEVIDRLRQLGASEQQIAANTIAVEQSSERLSGLRDALSWRRYPQVNLIRGDLFEQRFEPLDVVIGNPPYVRRWWMDPHLVEKLSVDSARLTDLACHFTKHAAFFLKPGGRLAVIIADSWLDARYGTAFKDYLLREFYLRSVVGFPESVFSNVDVRPVLLLAERRGGANNNSSTVTFQRLPDSSDTTRSSKPEFADITTEAGDTRSVAQDDLRAAEDWSVYLYAPDAYFRLVETNQLTPLGLLADTRIGLQTFARDFFVLNRTKARELEIEREFLVPFLYSPREIPPTRSLVAQDARQLLLACDKTKSELKATRILAYIQAAEETPYQPRGRAEAVVGAHNRPRVSRANREPWYNLKREIARRGAWPILLPRRIYVNYRVWANDDRVLASENFIEAKPKVGLDDRIVLAALASSFAEMSLRVNAHQYGGGIYDLSPGRMASILVPNVRKLSERACHHVCRTLDRMRDEDDPIQLSAVLGEALGFTPSLMEASWNACIDLRGRARRVGGRD